jgi:TfoX/Sxy family transcriptional regulator of competence genes
MSYNQELTERVRTLLVTSAHVTERKMFGSVGFLINGKLCIGVGDHPDHNIMVRVGPEQYKTALEQPGALPAIMRNRERPGYIFLKSETVASEKNLQYWVTLALKFTESL